jgi:hypothetical protein
MFGLLDSGYSYIYFILDVKDFTKKMIHFEFLKKHLDIKLFKEHPFEVIHKITQSNNIVITSNKTIQVYDPLTAEERDKRNTKFQE